MIKKIFYIIILLLCWHSVYSQKVGLVLSGGGAKGVTHIGVIRALEEAGIPIDYITGTSMGAIIGGLYAAGYSPDEMEMLISSLEFQEWLSGKVSKKYTYFFKKAAPNASWFDFKFKIDSIIKPSLPTNIISPVMMDFAFMEIFASASAAADYDFDKLMVPFRCVASDISKAESVILKRGELGKAIRASMTFPFYFKPIHIDDVLLFDGGMYNNFPSDIMFEEFFPDIIIGSQATTNYDEPNANDILSHLQNMLMLKNDFSVICENSVLIKPNLRSSSILDFSHNKEFIDSGYYEARRLISTIREFVVDTISYTEIENKRAQFNKKKPELLIGNIKVNGLKKSQYHYVNQVLKTEAIENFIKFDSINYLTLNMIKPQYYKFVAEEKIESIYPSLWFNRPSGNYDLNLDIQRQNEVIAEIGGTVTSSSVNELFLQLKYYNWGKNSMQFMANSYFGRFYNSAMAEVRVDFPKYNPFFISTGFVFNKFNYFKTRTYFYADDDPFFLMEQEKFAYLMIGFPVSNDGKIAVEMVSGSSNDQYYQTNSYMHDDILDKTSFSFFSPGILFEINSLNYKEYPTNGINFLVRANLITGNESFIPGTTSPDIRELKEKHTWLQASLIYENYFLHKGKYTSGLFAQINYSAQSNFSNPTASLLSATSFQPLSESSTRFMPIYRANRFIAIGLKNIYSLHKNIDIRLEGFLFMPNREIILDETSIELKPLSSIKSFPIIGSTIVYRSPIGPVSVNINYFDGEDKPISFFMKLGYLIFNRRPF